MSNKELQELEDIDKGIDSLNIWFIINTIFTLISGLALLILTIYSIFYD